MENKEKQEKFYKRGILGFFIGLAVIIPGISGSTISIIFKMYEKILHAVANFIKEFKTSILFLFPILIGAIVGVIFGFFTVQKLLNLIPFAIVSLFAGLMLGAIPSLKDEVKEVKVQKKHIILLILGILIPVVLSILSIVFSSNSSSIERLKINFISIILYLALGFIVAGTQFIPGCSATATLMALGFFLPLMNSFHFSYIKDNPAVLIVYIILIIGFIIGCAIFSKVISSLITKHKQVSYFLFIGLSIGSVASMFLNVDMIQIYKTWINESFTYVDILLGIGLFICGILIAYELVKFIRKKNN